MSGHEGEGVFRWWLQMIAAFCPELSWQVPCLIWCHFSAKMATNFHRISSRILSMEAVLKLFDDHFDGEGGRWHYQIGSTPCRKFGFPMLSCCVAPAGTSRGHDSWCFFLSHVGTRTPKTLGFTENLIKTFWCLVSREFSGMIHWLWIIIPATPSNPSIPYV